MNAVEEFSEVIRTRIKAPFFGFFIFVYVAFNWKALFYLFVSESAVLDRIGYFDTHTTLLTLLVYPVVIATAMTIGSPWLSAILLKVCAKPTSWKNEIQVETEHKMLVEKQKYEETRRKLQATLEQQLIEEAKRDEKIEEIEDEDKREQVKNEINSLRKQLATLDSVETKYIESEKFSDILEMPLLQTNLRIYSLKKFPDWEPNASLELLVMSDINRQKYKKIGDIHDAVNKADEFLMRYRKERPELFNYSTDFITKALGYVDKEFRHDHAFSGDTLEAIERYGRVSDATLA